MKYLIIDDEDTVYQGVEEETLQVFFEDNENSTLMNPSIKEVCNNSTGNSGEKTDSICIFCNEKKRKVCGREQKSQICLLVMGSIQLSIDIIFDHEDCRLDY